MRTIVAIDTGNCVISSKQVLFLFTARANFELIVSTSLRDQVSTGSCLLLDHLVVFGGGSDLWLSFLICGARQHNLLHYRLDWVIVICRPMLLESRRPWFQRVAIGELWNLVLVYMLVLLLLLNTCCIRLSLVSCGLWHLWLWFKLIIRLLF